MPTVKELLKEGYQFAENEMGNLPSFYTVDYDAVMEYDDIFLDTENKLIISVPVRSDITPESIEINFLFDSGKVTGLMSFSDECFKFTYKGEEVKDVLAELVFQYSDFACDIKEKIPTLGDFDGATLIVTGRNSAGDIFTEKSSFLCSSFSKIRPEVYSGVEGYFNDELYSFSNNLLMHEVYDINHLKNKINSLFGISLEE